MSKILIVDDDVIITDLMKMLVSMDGHQPVIVNDSMMAIETAAAVRPDVITLDLMMPGLTGFELCELLHNDPRFAGIPIIIVSARDDPGSREKALALGAAEYIIKPFGVDEFIERINSLAARPGARSDLQG